MMHRNPPLGSFSNRMDLLEIEVKNEPFMFQSLKPSIYLKKEWLIFANEAGQQRLHMNNHLDATIVVHFIVKTWIKYKHFMQWIKHFHWLYIVQNPFRTTCMYQIQNASLAVQSSKEMFVVCVCCEWAWIFMAIQEVKSAKNVAGEKIACSMCIYSNETNKVPWTTNWAWAALHTDNDEREREGEKGVLYTHSHTLYQLR